MPADSLLGRDAEIKQLTSLIGQARNGRGGAVLVTGEPGIGKTSLVDAAGAEARGLMVLK